MKIVVLFLFLFTSSFAFAQKKSSNNDLREKSEIFHIKDLKLKDGIFYKLESSNSGEFSLSKTIATADRVWKIDTKLAGEIDELFSDHFISMKYMMDKVKIEKCINVYQLSMRGETFNICDGDNARVRIVANFVTTLMKKIN
jgi:hypothetical protein